MRKDCDTCLHDEFGETYCNDCYWANGKPPTKWEPAPFWTPDTNADRIRAMSDEELRDFLFNKVSVDSICNFCVPKMRTERKCDGHCKNGILEWLKQPADMRGEEDG